MDGTDNLDRWGKLIVVDFEKRKIDLTYEYQVKWNELEQLKKRWTKDLETIKNLANSEAYKNLCHHELYRIIKELETRISKAIHRYI